MAGADDSLAARLDRLHDHLRATGERPLDAAANRWLGEAEAVAADIAWSDPDPATARERVATVRSLLAEVEEVDDSVAGDRIEAARSVCREILADE